MAAGLQYECKVDDKIPYNVTLFKPEKLMTDKSLFNEEYYNRKNSLKFDFHNYNLNNVFQSFKIHEYSNGNHWTFINENLSEITKSIKLQIFRQ